MPDLRTTLAQARQWQTDQKLREEEQNLRTELDNLNAETRSPRRSGCSIDEYAGRRVLTATPPSPPTTEKAVRVALYIPSVARGTKTSSSARSNHEDTKPTQSLSNRGHEKTRSLLIPKLNFGRPKIRDDIYQADQYEHQICQHPCHNKPKKTV